jgi:hypothetical protein
VEEYGPNIIYHPDSTKNIIANFLSHYPSTHDSPSEAHFLDKIFLLDDDDPHFPLAFNMISDHQSADTYLHAIATHNHSYQTHHQLQTHHPPPQQNCGAQVSSSKCPHLVSQYAGTSWQNPHIQNDCPAFHLESLAP